MCEVEGCSARVMARRLCAAHYHRWERYGSPHAGGNPIPYGRTDDERFWAKVAKEDGCWLWAGALDRHGYGVFRYEARAQRAHRVAWMLVNGSIPDGLVLDHLCRVPKCVNPAHLEPVTNRENVVVRSALSTSGRHARQTHCMRGHEFTLENTRVRKGRHGPVRACRTCEAWRAWGKHRG